MAPSEPRANTSMYGPYAAAAGPDVIAPPSDAQSVHAPLARCRSSIAPSAVRRANSQTSFDPREAAAGLSSYTSARAGALSHSAPATATSAAIHAPYRLTLIPPLI